MSIKTIFSEISLIILDKVLNTEVLSGVQWSVVEQILKVEFFFLKIFNDFKIQFFLKTETIMMKSAERSCQEND